MEGGKTAGMGGGSRGLGHQTGQVVPVHPLGDVIAVGGTPSPQHGDLHDLVCDGNEPLLLAIGEKAVEVPLPIGEGVAAHQMAQGQAGEILVEGLGIGEGVGALGRVGVGAVQVHPVHGHGAGGLGGVEHLGPGGGGVGQRAPAPGHGQHKEDHPHRSRPAGGGGGGEHLPEAAEQIDRFLSDKLRGQTPDPREKKRLTDALLRRGYGWGDVKAGWSRYGAEVLED